MIYRKYSNELIKLTNKIYGILLKKQMQGFPVSEALEEDKELCLYLANQLVEKLENNSTKEEVLLALSTEYKIYDNFVFSADEKWAISVVDEIMFMREDLQKYRKLSEEEKQKYPNEEVERLNQLEKKLKSYVEND